MALRIYNGILNVPLVVDGMFSLTIGREWGRETLMSVNSKTVAVLHVGGGEFLARAGAGAGQDGGQNIFYSRTLADETLYYPIMRVLSKTIRLKKLKSAKAQCIPFGLYIKDLKGICAQIRASLCARVLTKKQILNDLHPAQPLLLQPCPGTRPPSPPPPHATLSQSWS